MSQQQLYENTEFLFCHRDLSADVLKIPNGKKGWLVGNTSHK